MKLVGLVLVLSFARMGFAGEPGPLQRLRAKVEVECVKPLTSTRLAGKYSNPTNEFSPGLSGDDLYLFPDGTYIYDEWADIQPLTIYDKGQWRLEDTAVVLTSDKDITWDPGVERRFIALSRIQHPREILLLGVRDALARFEEATDVQPETELMIVAKERRATLESRASSGKIKKKLMRTAWNPTYHQGAKR